MQENLDYQCSICLKQLQYEHNPESKWICSCCSKPYIGIQKGKRLRCERDDFDICQDCQQRPQLPQKTGYCQYEKCTKELIYNNRNELWQCFGCNQNFNNVYKTWRYSCLKHKYNLCRQCVLQQKKYQELKNEFYNSQLPCVVCQELTQISQGKNEWKCSSCYRSYNKNTKRLRCDKDDFDICIKCFKNPQVQQFKGKCLICPEKLQYNPKNSLWICSYCNQNFQGVYQTQRYRCEQDDFDLCGKCINQPPLLFQQGSCNQCVDKLCYNNELQNWSCSKCRQKFKSVYQTQRYSCKTHEYDLCGPCSIKSEQMLLEQQRQLEIYKQTKYRKNLNVQGQINMQILEEKIQKMNIEQKNQEQQAKINKEIMKEQEQKPVDEKLQCKICLDQQSCYLNPQCGHLSVCENCVKGIKNICPICRKEGQFIKVYI